VTYVLAGVLFVIAIAIVGMSLNRLGKIRAHSSKIKPRERSQAWMGICGGMVPAAAGLLILGGEAKNNTVVWFSRSLMFVLATILFYLLIASDRRSKANSGVEDTNSRP
jgi:hypothetical protein